MRVVRRAPDHKDPSVQESLLFGAAVVIAVVTADAAAAARLLDGARLGRAHSHGPASQGRNTRTHTVTQVCVREKERLAVASAVHARRQNLAWAHEIALPVRLIRSERARVADSPVRLRVAPSGILDVRISLQTEKKQQWRDRSVRKRTE